VLNGPDVLFAVRDGDPARSFDATADVVINELAGALPVDYLNCCAGCRVGRISVRDGRRFGRPPSRTRL